MTDETTEETATEDHRSSLHDDPSVFPHLPGQYVDETTLDSYAEPGSEFRAAWEYVLSHAMSDTERSAFWHGVGIQRAASVLQE